MYKFHDTDEAIARPFYRELRHTYVVDGLDTSEEVMFAVGDDGIAVPRIGEASDFNPFLLVDEVHPLREAPFFWKVDVHYSYPPPSQGVLRYRGPSGGEIHYDMGVATQTIYKDLAGAPIGDENDPQGQFGTEVMIPTFDVIVEMPSPARIDKDLWLALALHVNSESFLGFAHSTVQYMGTQASKLLIEGGIEYHVRHRFRAGELKVVDGQANVGIQFVPWWTWKMITKVINGVTYEIRIPDVVNYARVYPTGDLNPLLET